MARVRDDPHFHRVRDGQDARGAFRCDVRRQHERGVPADTRRAKVGRRHAELRTSRHELEIVQRLRATATTTQLRSHRSIKGEPALRGKAITVVHVQCMRRVGFGRGVAVREHAERHHPEQAHAAHGGVGALIGLSLPILRKHCRDNTARPRTRMTRGIQPERVGLHLAILALDGNARPRRVGEDAVGRHPDDEVERVPHFVRGGIIRQDRRLRQHPTRQRRHVLISFDAGDEMLVIDPGQPETATHVRREHAQAAWGVERGQQVAHDVGKLRREPPLVEGGALGVRDLRDILARAWQRREGRSHAPDHRHRRVGGERGKQRAARGVRGGGLFGEGSLGHAPRVRPRTSASVHRQRPSRASGPSRSGRAVRGTSRHGPVTAAGEPPTGESGPYSTSHGLGRGRAAQ